MAIQPANQPPASMPAGGTTDPPYGVFAQSGMSNPFFYHQFQDDFDNQLGAAGIYTATGTGTTAHTAGDGGLALQSTTATASTFATIQLPAGSFVLPSTGATPPASSGSVKKMFYICRFQLSDVTLSGFIAGLCATTATSFSGGNQNIADGLFFYKAPGAANNLVLLNLASAANSPSGVAVSNTFTIPTSAYTLTNAVNLDMGYWIDRFQNLRVFVNAQLVGWIPQSGTGATVVPSGVTVLPQMGPVLANYNYLSQATGAAGNVATPILFSTAALSPTLGVSNGVTAAIKTATIDFHCAQKER